MDFYKVSAGRTQVSFCATSCVTDGKIRLGTLWYSLSPQASGRTRTLAHSLVGLHSSASLSNFIISREKKNKHTQSPHSIPKSCSSHTQASCEPDVCPHPRCYKGFPGSPWADERENKDFWLQGTGWEAKYSQRPRVRRNIRQAMRFGAEWSWEAGVLNFSPCSAFY